MKVKMERLIFIYQFYFIESIEAISSSNSIKMNYKLGTLIALNEKDDF